jgi:cytochrome c-type biogenesis protein CcmF
MGRANGGMIVHLGVIVLAVAFVASNAYQTEREARMCLTPTEGCPSTISVSGHTLTFVGVADASTAAFRQTNALIDVDGQIFEPGIQQFPNGTQQIGKPTVRNTATDSVLLALLDLPDGSGDDVSVRIRAIRQPLIVWLWIGGGIMAWVPCSPRSPAVVRTRSTRCRLRSPRRRTQATAQIPTASRRGWVRERPRARGR